MNADVEKSRSTTAPDVEHHDMDHAFGRTVATLAFAIFTVVTTEFVVVGLLPVLARDLHASLVDVGRLVTWFALAAAVAGPPLAAMAARKPAGVVLVASMLVFAATNMLFAVASSQSVLVASRLVQGACLPVFVSVASATVTNLAGPGHERKAISLLYAGVAGSTVFGVPIGSLLADRAGWRTTFFVLAALATVSTALLATTLPRRKAATPPSVGTQLALLARPTFLGHLALSAVVFAGMFAGYTYLAAFLEHVAGLSGGSVAVGLFGFGLAGLAGNTLAGRSRRSQSPSRTAGDSLMATVLVAVVLGIAMVATTRAASSRAWLFAAGSLWGGAHAAAFVVNQVRVMAAGRDAPAFAAALNISVCNAGIALGSAIGGFTVVRYGVGSTGLSGASVVALAVPLAALTRWLASVANERPDP